MGGGFGGGMNGQDRDRAEPSPESGEDLRERVGAMDHDEASAGAQQGEAGDDPCLQRLSAGARRRFVEDMGVGLPRLRRDAHALRVEERRVGEDEIGGGVDEAGCAPRAGLADIDAEDAGLRGNTHIAFADLNNEAVANELSKWLHRKGLDKDAFLERMLEGFHAEIESPTDEPEGEMMQ